MKKLIILVGFFLSSCTIATTAHMKFPDVPPTLQEECGALLTLNKDAKLSDVMITVVLNYTKYHECKLKNQAWKDWYQQQREIYNKGNKNH